ncbi:ribokinase [Vagococcus intermedius]|uniref:Deoxyribokinase n=1 Tax=Vagococcus intermedius TaxID=2991418 RepID=A0AAF0I6A3_9ENTE|nr:ribokinase [Vagococcus intermedius]WEG73468.1 ribokinase [Vagococcus intermedius]WEG75551.1 ribokinase [Vagococcus intermedius]
MTDITVIGSNMIDLITYTEKMPLEGETIEAPEFEMGFGGKGSNQAVAAARLGSKVSMITMVGNDSFGKEHLANYQDNNIDVTGVGIGTKSSGTAPIFVSQDSSNRILIIKGANNELTPTILDTHLDTIKQSKLIVLQQEIPLETNYHAIELGEKLGIPVLLNPAPASEHLDLEHVRKVDFFMPNETELATLTGLPTESLDEITLAAKSLVEQGVKHVIVTLGSRGVLWINKDNDMVIPSEKVHAIDTTGAGDAFIGAFSHYLTQGEDIPEALKHANHYAGISVTNRGTQKSYPTLAEI